MKAYTYDTAIAEFAPGLKTMEGWRRSELKIEEQFPIHTTVTAVVYDSKTDRYTVKFNGSSARTNADVAQFILTHLAGAPPDGGDRKPGTWFLKMEQGTVTDVIVVYV